MVCDRAICEDDMSSSSWKLSNTVFNSTIWCSLSCNFVVNCVIVERTDPTAAVLVRKIGSSSSTYWFVSCGLWTVQGKAVLSTERAIVPLTIAIDARTVWLWNIWKRCKLIFYRFKENFLNDQILYLKNSPCQLVKWKHSYRPTGNDTRRHWCIVSC